jgi:hypothetical protein
MIAVEPEITTSTPAASIGGVANPAGAVVGGLVAAGFVFEGTVVRDECPTVLDVEPCEAPVGADEQAASRNAMTSAAGRGTIARKRLIVERVRLGIGPPLVFEWLVMVRRRHRRSGSRWIGDVDTRRRRRRRGPARHWELGLAESTTRRDER